MFFVYVDYTVDDGRPFYVGKGRAHRLSRMARGVHHDRVARKHGMRRVIVLETPDEFEAFNREIRLIAELHTYFKDPHFNGVGTNHTIGGDGAAGKVVTPTARANMSAAQRKMTPETKAKMSATKKNMSAETRRKISDAGRKRKHSPETRTKMAAAHAGKKLGPASDEARKNMSLAHRGKSGGFKGRFHSEETKAKMAVAHLGKVATAETRSKMSASQQAAATPERREKLRQAALKQWAVRRVLNDERAGVQQQDEDNSKTQEKFNVV